MRLLLLLLACADRPIDLPEKFVVSPGTDLSVHFSGRDLSSEPDLAPPPFCSGTKLAGTCAQAFFAPVAACFSPLGACMQQQSQVNGNLREVTCWASGLRRQVDSGGENGTTHSTWTNAGGTVCLTCDASLQYSTCTVNGKTLIYDDGTGALTCADGSTANIGTADNGDLCPAVANILFNLCTAGTCS